VHRQVRRSVAGQHQPAARIGSSYLGLRRLPARIKRGQVRADAHVGESVVHEGGNRIEDAFSLLAGQLPNGNHRVEQRPDLAGRSWPGPTRSAPKSRQPGRRRAADPRIERQRRAGTPSRPADSRARTPAGRWPQPATDRLGRGRRTPSTRSPPIPGTQQAPKLGQGGRLLEPVKRGRGHDRVERVADVGLFEGRWHHPHPGRHRPAEVSGEPLVRLDRDNTRPQGGKVPGHQPRSRTDLEYPAAGSHAAP
jgi:hypothetical protein